MKNIIYFIGGTGTRTESAFLHLIAMGLLKEANETVVITVDKDDVNGNTKKANQLLQQITSLSQARYNTSGNNTEWTKSFCRVPVSSYKWSFSDKLKALSTQQTIDEKFKNAYPYSRERNILLKAFFTKEEEEMSLDVGFKGHPNIGAPLFETLLENETPAEAGSLMYPITSYLSANRNEHVKVFIIGSIFGGTGASCFSNLARYIYEQSQKGDLRGHVHIAGSLVLPYFGFEVSANAETSIHPENYFSESRVALRYYADQENLLALVDDNNKIDRGIFEALYIIGQSELHKTPYAVTDGKEKQKNHFDLVDIMSAYFAVDFLNREANDEHNYCINKNKNSNVFIYNRAEGTEFTLDHLPEDLKKGILGMLRFSILMLCNVRDDLLNSKNTTPGYMLKALFDKIHKSDFSMPSKKNAEAQEFRTKTKDFLEPIFIYCEEFIDLAHDLAYNGRDWQNPDAGNNDCDYFDLLNPNLLTSLVKKCSENIKSKLSPLEKNSPEKSLSELMKAVDYCSAKKYASADMVFQKLNSTIFKNAHKAIYGGTQDFNENIICDYIHVAFKECNN